MKIFLTKNIKFSTSSKKKNDKLKISDEAIIIYQEQLVILKGVVLTHGNIIADAYAISKNFKFNDYTRTLCIFTYVSQQWTDYNIFAPLYAGGSTVITTGKTNLYNFWNYVSKF